MIIVALMSSITVMDTTCEPQLLFAGVALSQMVKFTEKVSNWYGKKVNIPVDSEILNFVVFSKYFKI